MTDEDKTDPGRAYCYQVSEESSCPRRHKACRGVLSGPVMPVTAEGHGEGFAMITTTKDGGSAAERHGWRERPDGKKGQSSRVEKKGSAENSNPPPITVYGWLAGAAKLKSARNMINHIE